MCMSKGHKGFTLVEIMTAIVILTLLMGMATATMSSVIRDTRFKAEVAQVDGLIRRTMNECLARGRAGELVVEGSTITGSLILDDDSRETVDTATLTNGTFTRTNAAATPWLGEDQVEVASSFEEDTCSISATGTLAASGVIYMAYEGQEAAIELLANGTIDSFYYGGTDSKGADIWTR